MKRTIVSNKSNVYYINANNIVVNGANSKLYDDDITSDILKDLILDNKNAITDAGVACLFADAAIRGALFNVKINLMSIKDESIKQKIAKDMNRILDGLDKKKSRILEIVNQEISD